jgi:hypothetical protein
LTPPVGISGTSFKGPRIARRYGTPPRPLGKTLTAASAASHAADISVAVNARLGNRARLRNGRSARYQVRRGPKRLRASVISLIAPGVFSVFDAGQTGIDDRVQHGCRPTTRTAADAS